MNFRNEINRLQEMLRLRNSNQDPPVDLYDLKGSGEGNNKIDSLTKEPSDTLLMGDEVISTTPKRENDEFIKSSVDDLVPIPRESEGRRFDINSPLGEYGRLLVGDSRNELACLRAFGNSNSMSRSSETSDLFEELIAEFGLDDSIPTKIDDSFDPFVEIPSSESKVHIDGLSVLWGNRLPIPDGSLPLS
ncbi:hypothetical protein Tco_1064077, partial [Tanacetum coccineum]